MKKYDYILIGNSTASVAAIEGIRSVDPRGSILVVGDEERFVYGRPLISYYLLGATDERRMDYRPRSFYEDNGAELRLGVRAERIDPAAKTVTFADGSAAKYGRLLVATGSRPFDPPMEGIESVPHRFHFMKMADALALEKYLSPAARVLIVGAGLIGLKCFEGIADRVGSVAVEDVGVAGRVVDPRCADPRRLQGVCLRERTGIGERAEDGVRIVVELEELVARPCGEHALGSDEPAGEFAARHRLHDSAVAHEIIGVHVVEQHHEVDVAVLARLASSAAPLDSNESQAPSELRLQFPSRLFRPCDCVHAVSLLRFPRGRLYKSTHV